MPEENSTPMHKLLKPQFVEDPKLTTHFINTLNVRGGVEEFYLTFGTALPIEITKPEDLEQIDSIQVQPTFRCVITRQNMKQMIELLQTVYEQTSKQLDLLQELQGKDQEE